MPPCCPMCHASLYSIVEAINHYCIEGEVLAEVQQVDPAPAQLALPAGVL